MKYAFLILIFCSVLTSSKLSAQIDSLAKAPEPDDQIYTKVEVAPQFPGGLSAMGPFISKHIQYPASARVARQEGNVFVRFIVNEIGDVTSVSIAKGVNADLDSAAVNVVRHFPRWSPGRQDGDPVKVMFVLPIQFRLADGEQVLRQVDKMPAFPGGVEGLHKHIAANLRYPESAKQRRAAGLVVVEFVVEKDGRTTSVRAITDSDRELADEAVRVVKNFPKWTPGKQNGKPVAVVMTVPVAFK